MKNLIIPDQLLLKAKSLIANRQNDDIDLTHAIVLIDMALQEMNWISVEDRLPEGCNVGLNKLFIVAVGLPERTLFTYYAWFDGNEFYCSDFGGNINSLVTHWMPLPEPPKES
jgi:hypothetical protein